MDLTNSLFLEGQAHASIGGRSFILGSALARISHGIEAHRGL